MSEFTTSVVEVYAVCFMCGLKTTALATQDDFERWFCDGELIQVAMPEAPPATREVFLGWRSGVYMCEACTEPLDA